MHLPRYPVPEHAVHPVHCRGHRKRQAVPDRIVSREHAIEAIGLYVTYTNLPTTSLAGEAFRVSLGNLQAERTCAIQCVAQLQGLLGSGGIERHSQPIALHTGTLHPMPFPTIQ